MRRILTTLIAAATTAAFAVPAHAQDALTEVRTLYTSAAYEDALAALAEVRDPGARARVEQYRAYCLIALGRVPEARDAIERVVSSDPALVPDAAEASPRVQSLFAEVRSRLLPEVVKQLYSQAKADFEGANRSAAHAGFKKVVQLVDSLADEQKALHADLRLVALGFVDLSREPALAAPKAPGSTPANFPRETGSVAGAATAANSQAMSAARRGETRGALVVRQNLPPWNPAGTRGAGREYRGRIRLAIDASGQVRNVQIVQPSFPSYDQVLLQTAKQWQYQPALSNGQPIASEREVEVVLKPR